MEHFFFPPTIRAGLQLKDNAVSLVAALVRSTVEIASGVEDQVAIGMGSVVAAGESVNDALGPSAGTWGQLKMVPLLEVPPA